MTKLIEQHAWLDADARRLMRMGADVKEVARGMGLDGRIGNKFLHAGPGYGGSCFPKDTSALARTGQEYGVPQRIAETVIAVNDMTKRRMIDKVMDLCGGSVNGRKIAVLGVTFKPETDDMREAPSLTIVPALACRCRPNEERATFPSSRPCPCQTPHGCRTSVGD